MLTVFRIVIPNTVYGARYFPGFFAFSACCILYYFYTYWCLVLYVVFGLCLSLLYLELLLSS